MSKNIKNINLIELIKQNFIESIETKQSSQSVISENILSAVNLIVETFQNGNKMLICGNGGSAADAQHFAAEFTGRYEMERKSLPAIALTTDTSALTAIGNDYGFDSIFSKQVEALGVTGDILYAISTSGNSRNVIKAMEVAQKIGMHIIIMTGGVGGEMAQLVASQHNHPESKTVSLCVPAKRTARIQEVHLLILHTICDAVDNIMFKF